MIMAATTSCQAECGMQKKSKPRDWMSVMIDREVLVDAPEEHTPLPVPDGVVLVIDSETDPTHIVSFGRKGHPVVLIANEAGVLIASPDTTVRDELEIDAENVIFGPISRARSEGVQKVLLVVNPNSTRGLQVTMGTVEMIDHMMRAGSAILRLFPGIMVAHIVHVVHNDGTYTNYFVQSAAWTDFYNDYEIEVLGRLDDPDGEHVTDPLFGQM